MEPDPGRDGADNDLVDLVVQDQPVLLVVERDNGVIEAIDLVPVLVLALHAVPAVVQHQRVAGHAVLKK